MNRFVLYIVIAFLFASFVTPVLAIEDPLGSPNNKFGIHIIDENDLKDAANLVNSNGGEWGYVTLVIRENERDHARWQQTFTKMRELKLIPIIRLASEMDGNSWKAPKPEDAEEWANFLGSLDWVVKNRYVILFNEPNQAKEWGGNISPEEYTKVARAFWEQLKKQSPDFFVLPAGFDAAALDGKTTLNEVSFWKRMYEIDPLIFTIFDGWTSHSYPNPGFSGSPLDTGKTSIRSFKWEVEYLNSYGIPSDIPIFITETGWTHSGSKVDLEKLAEKYKIAYEDAWNDPHIVAITPFVLSYLSPPFNSFTWKAPTTSEELPHFNMVQGIQKVRGEPASTDSPMPTVTPVQPSPFYYSSYGNVDEQDKPLLQQLIDLLSKVTERFLMG